MASITDARDLRATISELLTIEPLDACLLRQAVWTYVGTERGAGVSPGRVILSLTDLIERAPVTPVELRLSLTRDVILWCVEAYLATWGGRLPHHLSQRGCPEVERVPWRGEVTEAAVR